MLQAGSKNVSGMPGLPGSKSPQASTGAADDSYYSVSSIVTGNMVSSIVIFSGKQYQGQEYCQHCQ